MNKASAYGYKKKAIPLVCLFLFLAVAISQAQDFAMSAHVGSAYNHVLNLRFKEARQMLATPSSPQEIYVVSLADALELLITEDRTLLETYEASFEKRPTRKLKSKTPDDILVQCEMHLHWAFVYLKFGQELDAAFRLRQAYLLAKEIRQKHPDYKAILKTSGLLNVLVGSVPEKYTWILSLLNMQGDVNEGLNQMFTLAESNHDFAFEARLWHAFIQGFVLQDPIAALTAVQQSDQRNPLVLFLLANFHMKNSDSEKALVHLEKLRHSQIKIPYVEYLLGEVYLHKGVYSKAITGYSSFLDQYVGENFVKDAHYKIGMCHWLNGNREQALKFFDEARDVGKESGEADRHAARNLAAAELPSVTLTKIRYFTDGGYYAEAAHLFEQIQPESLPTPRLKTECHYRKARLFHKQGLIKEAKSSYFATIDQAGQGEWYYAPNSCLQLGYIFLEEGELKNARLLFEKALTYKRHEYKNSIDSKAKSALAQLKDRK